MATVNLSLTSDQLKWIDQTSGKFGFANRSEFIRSLLRFISQREDLLPSAQTYPFITPPITDKSEILNSFQKTGKYSKKFLADLKAGLSRSDLFK